MTLTFDALCEDIAGPKCQARCQRSWPNYEAWFIARDGDAGPDRAACLDALQTYMPEIVPVYERLVALTGGTDRAARFLSTWCPPRYLGGCSLAAMADETDVRLLRNYDLSPDQSEGLLLRSVWTGRPVMGMVEFLWGLSDGINATGLCVAHAFGGQSQIEQGFGVSTILRYILEVCDTVKDALAVLDRVPAHMAYNVVLADASGPTASVELSPSGGARRMPKAIATNHQTGAPRPERAAFTRTYERHTHLMGLPRRACDLYRAFTKKPLLHDRYDAGFGTLFTAEYDPKGPSLRLIWPGQDWYQSLDGFAEGQRVVNYAQGLMCDKVRDAPRTAVWGQISGINWDDLVADYSGGLGHPITNICQCSAVAQPI